MEAAEAIAPVTIAPEIATGPRPLEAPFWRFFLVCLLFDLGFGLYFFLINLYLAQSHFGENKIGLIAGALTVGNLVATLPTGILARRIGLRPMFLFCFLVAPLLAAIRIIAMHPAMQMVLAFGQGAAMCSYTVCFAPAIAHLTTQQNRTRAFSITFATGIGSGVLGGFIGGFIPAWLQHFKPSIDLRSGMGYVLLLGCGLALLSVLPLLRLRFPALQASSTPPLRAVVCPFLIRFLSAVAVWDLAIGAFAPFATIYLSSRIKIPLARIGLIFSSSQFLQVIGVMLAPVIYRRIGQQRGIAGLQAGAAVGLILLCTTRSPVWAVGSYLLLTMFQYMCNPAIYGLLMDYTDEGLRSSASALQNFVACSSLALASALGGLVIVQFGYRPMFAGCAALSIAGAALITRVRA